MLGVIDCVVPCVLDLFVHPYPHVKKNKPPLVCLTLNLALHNKRRDSKRKAWLLLHSLQYFTSNIYCCFHYITFLAPLQCRINLLYVIRVHSTLLLPSTNMISFFIEWLWEFSARNAGRHIFSFKLVQKQINHSRTQSQTQINLVCVYEWADLNTLALNALDMMGPWPNQCSRK